MPKEDRDARDAALKGLKRALGATEYAQFKAFIKDLKELSQKESPDPRLLRSSELELRTLFRRPEAFAILKESYKHFIPRELPALRDVIKAARGSLTPLPTPAPPAASLPAPAHLTSSAGRARDGPGTGLPSVNGLLQDLAKAGMLPPASCSQLSASASMPVSHLSASASMPVVHDLAPTAGLGSVWPGAPREQRAPLTAQQERARADAAKAVAAGWTPTAPPPAPPPTERAIFEEQERSGFAQALEPPPPAAPPPMSAALASILSRPKPAASRPGAGAPGAAAGGKRAAAAAAVPKSTGGGGGGAATAAVRAPPPPSAKPATPASNTSGDPSRRHGGYAPVSAGARLVENRVNAITAVMQQAWLGLGLGLGLGS